MAAFKTNHLIITTHGADGACSAAMALLKHPKAEVWITSARRIHQTLQRLSEYQSAPDHIFICGVGVQDNIERIIDALQILQENQSMVSWFCGRGYLNPYIKALSSVCHIVFSDASSNTALIQKHFNLKSGKQSRQLLDIANEFVKDSGAISKKNQFLRDLMGASESHYFKFQNRDAYIKVIYKLADIYPITDEDRRMVEVYQNNENKVVPLGDSEPMQKIRKLVKRVGPYDEPVLILGPTGSGKEIVARTIHEASNRSGPFVAINCAVFSSNADLAHDRLFGHVEGAYTGATDAKPGAFDAADGGTLFLDELAELPLSVQTQLLRVLEEGCFSPLGTIDSRRAQTRVIAATNQNLTALIQQGKHRSDLYHRLNVLQIQIPPLKERMEDIKTIANSEMYTLGKKGIALSLKKKDWDAIHAYDWPGNIRQFINLLKRSAYMKIPMHEVIDSEITLNANAETHANEWEESRMFRPRQFDESLPLQDIQKSYAQHVLKLAGGNKTKTAKQLGIVINTLKSHLGES